MTLDEILNVIYPEISKYPSDQLVLGGSYALELHGLKVWEPKDIDFILFEFTEQQHDYILNNSEYKQGGSGDFEDNRSWTVEFKGINLNIILAKEPRPKGLMEYFFKGWYMFVNSIDRIITAKVSYMEGGEAKKYLRGKDVRHLQFLKNNNFNYPEYKAAEPDKPITELTLSDLVPPSWNFDL